MNSALISMWLLVSNIAALPAVDPLAAACILVTLLAFCCAVAGMVYIAWTEYTDWRDRKKVKKWQT